MQTVKEFGGSTAKMSLRQFWMTTGPAVASILLLALVMVLWERLIPMASRVQIKLKLFVFLWNLLPYFLETVLEPIWIYVMKFLITMEILKSVVKEKFRWSRGEKVSDLETSNSGGQAPARPSSQEQALAGLPPSHPGEGTERSSI